MIAKNLIVAAAVFVSATSAIAAAAPETASTAAAAAATSAATAAATSAATAARLNLPTLGAPSDASRGDVKTEAADALKDYRSTLSVQLDQYKN